MGYCRFNGEQAVYNSPNQTMHFYQAFDLLTERGYRVRHNGTAGFALWAVSKPIKQGGYHQPVEMTDSAFLALAAGQWSI